MTLRALPVLIALLALAGCGGTPRPQASMEPENFQSVRVDTPGVFGAACTLQTIKGSHVLLSPASVSVARTPEPIRISCTKGEHFYGARVVVPRRIPGEDSQVAYVFPASVSVPMELNDRSLSTDVRVF